MTPRFQLSHADVLRFANDPARMKTAANAMLPLIQKVVDHLDAHPQDENGNLAMEVVHLFALLVMLSEKGNAVILGRTLAANDAPM
jgi:hypothetical protein